MSASLTKSLPAGLYPSPRQMVEDMAYECEQLARDYEREAKRLRALSKAILNPPEGVTVEPGWNSVFFVGPVIDHSKIPRP